MPQKGDRRGQVLHWDEVYGQYARAAASMPAEEVDRELAAMGYDLDRLGGAIGRLGPSTGARATDGTSMACREERPDRMLPPLPQPAPHVVANGTGAGRRHGGRRRGARWAVAAVALLALLAVPTSETSPGYLPTALIAKSDKPAHVRIAEANPAGFTQNRDSDSPDITNLPNAKVAPLEKCEGVGVHAKVVAAGDKLAKIAADEMPIGDDRAGAPAGAENAKRPLLMTKVRGQGPASVG
jgi:hypothetical protein